MTCEYCGRDAYYINDENDVRDGLPLCEGCDTPTDACTCDPQE